MLRLIQYGNSEVRKTWLESFKELLSLYTPDEKETEIENCNTK